jgi:glycosyltransferase involved in cell wall biosynthesis
MSPDPQTPCAERATADISVIICAYTLKRWEDLLNAVASVSTQTIAPRETIVIVDNNADLLARASDAFSGVTVVANRQAPGLCGARNTGAEVAASAVLAFLDDDAVASSAWLEQHLLGYADRTVLGVGGEVTPIWRSDPPRWLPGELYWTVGCTYTGLPTRPAPIRNPIGANMSMRADVFARTGGFQPELGRHDIGGKVITGTADETEFCIRASKHFPDGQWVYRPQASVRHVVSEHRGTWEHFVARCRLEGGSKAVLVGLRGQRSGLQSERRYVTRVLPLGVLRELSGALRREPNALRRAGAILAGLTITSLTYARARAEIRLGRGQRYST